jgi:hypothetical protein
VGARPASVARQTVARLQESQRSVADSRTGLKPLDPTDALSWRRRLAQDGALLGRLTRIAVETVLTFYADRAGQEGGHGAKSGAVTAVQRTSSDLRLNPHLHTVALDGTWFERGGELAWEGLGHLRTSEVGKVLERVGRRMETYLRRADSSGPLRTRPRRTGRATPKETSRLRRSLARRRRPGPSG